jgi:hypothetical protein
MLVCHEMEQSQPVYQSERAGRDKRWQEHTSDIAQVTAVFARSHDSNPVILATGSGNPTRSKQSANCYRGKGNLHRGQFRKTGVDEADEDGADDEVPEDAGSATIGESDADGAGDLSTTVSRSWRRHIRREGFPGPEQDRRKGKQGDLAEVTLGGLDQTRWTEGTHSDDLAQLEHAHVATVVVRAGPS